MESRESLKKLMARIAETERLATYSYDECVNRDATAKEGNFSRIVTMTLTGERRTTNAIDASRVIDLPLLIKYAPLSASPRGRTPIREMYARESYVYDRLFAAIRTILSRRSMSHRFDFVPRLYAYDLDDGNESLVLDDLKRRGYRLRDALSPMTDPYLMLCLERYARLHAYGYALKRYDGERYAEAAKKLRRFVGDDAQWPEFVVYIDQVLALVEGGLKGNRIEDEGLCEAFERYKSGYKGAFSDDSDECDTLLHGDCWNNNFLFKHDADGNLNRNDEVAPTHVKLLDFQFAAIGSPAKDVTYFLYSNLPSTAYDRIERYERHYHERLSNELCSLDLDDCILPFDAFHQQIRRCARYGVTMSLAIAYLKLLRADEDPTAEENATRCGDENDSANKNEGADDSSLTPVNLIEFYRVTGDLLRHCHRMKYI